MDSVKKKRRKFSLDFQFNQRNQNRLSIIQTHLKPIDWRFDFENEGKKLTSLQKSKEASKNDRNRGGGGDGENPRTGAWRREGDRVAGPETHVRTVRCREFHGFFFETRLQMMIMATDANIGTRSETEKTEISRYEGPAPKY